MCDQHLNQPPYNCNKSSTSIDVPSQHTSTDCLKEITASLKELVPVFKRIAEALEKKIEQDQENIELIRITWWEIRWAGYQLWHAGVEIHSICRDVMEAEEQSRKLESIVKEAGDLIKRVATHRKEEKTVVATTDLIVTQQNRLLHNIDIIMPRILSTLLDQLLSQRKTTTERIHETLLKVVIDIYNQCYKQEGATNPRIFSG